MSRFPVLQAQSSASRDTDSCASFQHGVRSLAGAAIFHHLGKTSGAGNVQPTQPINRLRRLQRGAENNRHHAAQTEQNKGFQQKRMGKQN